MNIKIELYIFECPFGGMIDMYYGAVHERTQQQIISLKICRGKSKNHLDISKHLSVLLSNEIKLERRRDINKN